MFYEVPHWRSQQRLRARQERIDRQFDRDVRRARATKKDFEYLSGLEDGQRTEWRIADDDIQEAETKHLLRKARHLGVPVPWTEAGAWDRTFMSERRILTTEAQHALRKALRIEARARTDGIKSWLPTIFAILSSIAAWYAASRK